MVEKVKEVWAAKDGTLYRSELEAQQHEAKDMVERSLCGIAKLVWIKEDGCIFKTEMKSMIPMNGHKQCAEMADDFVSRLNAWGFKIVPMTDEEKQNFRC